MYFYRKYISSEKCHKGVGRINSTIDTDTKYSIHQNIKYNLY